MNFLQNSKLVYIFILLLFLCSFLFYTLEPQLAFLQTTFPVMRVNAAFRGKLIRNQPFAFKVSNVSALHFLLLTNIHTHTLTILHACWAVWTLSCLHQLNVGVDSALKPAGFEYEYINHFIEY